MVVNAANDRKKRVRKIATENEILDAYGAIK